MPILPSRVSNTGYSVPGVMPASISVRGSTTQNKVVNVNNVAPTIALGGAAGVQVGQVYTLNLGAITDPGQDTVSSYLINWGDGSAVQTVNSAGNVTHTYGSAGSATIAVAVWPMRGVRPTATSPSASAP